MRSDRVVLEANTDYWDKTRLPRLQRIVFDNTIEQRDAVELVNKAVEFISYVSTLLTLDATSVTAEHWSLRKQKATTQKR